MNGSTMRRTLDTVVISDTHLGTVGCHALELAQYLNSIKTRRLILNGDIIDFWNISKYFWPESHMVVIKRILQMAAEGTEIYYLTGNHDEALRKISILTVGGIHIKDKLLLELNGDQCWFFHGDVFDVTMRHSKWIAKMGGYGYDLLILLNRGVNYVLEQLGRPKISLSKRIKNSVKQAIKFIDDFETTAMELAIENGYEYVVCGHIHQPKIKKHVSGNGEVIYMNSGDWVESLTSLEFDGTEWQLYRFELDENLAMEMEYKPVIEPKDLEEIVLAG